ncbi:MAG TPA: L-lactate dehydrogenase [Candidatus Limnocylindrales bacterium]|nr:L-lactate dehydrogenase [Candidatus Limnocylindrales bacterium]
MKIGVVGAGMVGSTAAYALVMRGVGREVVLVDKNHKRAVAEAEDIFHAVPFAEPMVVRAGDYADLQDAGVVVMSAGVSQQPGETRLHLLERNAAVFNEAIPAILDHAPNAVLVVATNPVDIMTHLAAHIARERGIPDGRVFGTGTMLDTARFRALLSQELGVDSAHVHAYVLGEHGDSEVLAWSLTSVGGLPLNVFLERASFDLTDAERVQIDDGVRRAAYRIIDGKGATYYGVGSAIAKIVDVVLHDQRAILSVCAPHDDVMGVHDVTLALPHIVGGWGVIESIDTPLLPDEADALRHSAEILREAISGLGL